MGGGASTNRKPSASDQVSIHVHAPKTQTFEDEPTQQQSQQQQQYQEQQQNISNNNSSNASNDNDDDSESPSSTRHQHPTVPRVRAAFEGADEGAATQPAATLQPKGTVIPNTELHIADVDEKLNLVDGKRTITTTSTSANATDEQSVGAAAAPSTGGPAKQPGGFHDLLMAGYSEACQERERWLKSIAANSDQQQQQHEQEEQEEEKGGEEEGGPISEGSASRPVVLRAPVAAAPGHHVQSQQAIDAEEISDSTSAPTLLPLRDRAPVVAEELKRWTQRMGDRDWPVVHTRGVGAV